MTTRDLLEKINGIAASLGLTPNAPAVVPRRQENQPPPARSCSNPERLMNAVLLWLCLLLFVAPLMVVVCLGVAALAVRLFVGLL
jgi:hypothetical protein